MAAPLRQWCEHAAADERRTAILRPTHSTDVTTAAREVEAHGAEVQSAGPGAITVVASPESLVALSNLEWVVAVEEPRRLFTRSPSGG